MSSCNTFMATFRWCFKSVAKYTVANPTFWAGLAAVGAVVLAVDESRLAARGEKGHAERAVEYWKQVQENELANVEREGHSVKGAFKFVGARFGQAGAGVIHYSRKGIVRALEFIFD